MASDSDQIFEAVLALPLQERLRLVERVIHQMTEPPAAAPAGAQSIIGLFEDQAELLDDVVAEAMQARNRDPLRR